MDTMDRKVVIIVTPRVSKDRSTRTFMAAIPEMGLVGYGDSHDDAVRRVNALVDVAVRAHRKSRTLARWLDRSGLAWWWLGDHPDDLLVEYANGKGIAASPKQTGKVRASVMLSEPYPLPVAA